MLEKTTLLAHRHQENARSQALAWERNVLEALPPALNIFELILTNENMGRESEAPAELFRPRTCKPLLVTVERRPMQAPQERRPPEIRKHRQKRCLERWCEAPAELLAAAKMPTIACERIAAALDGSAGASPSRIRKLTQKRCVERWRSAKSVEKTLFRVLNLPACLFLVLLLQPFEIQKARVIADSPFNTHQREPWAIGTVQGSPDPADPFTTQPAFPKLQLFEPLSVGLVPGSNKFGVATRPGKIYTFEIDPETSQAQLLIDIQKTTYGLVFHPKFAENGFFYVTYLLDPSSTDEAGSRLSRFEAKRDGTLTANPSSEQIIFTWPSGGHNGGCIRFGPDGYLYLATGDSSGIADGLLTGQNISDLSGSILRIDVDHSTDGRSYSIPSDNPFVSTAGARGEVFSFGLRQVWKFSFDDQRRLWAGDVGQDLWEMVHIIERGGNYGWSVREGSHPFRPERPRGPGSFVAPIVEHSHSDFRSITGGYVSRTTRLPELDGAYVYGDYDTGKLWSLRYRDGKVSDHRQLADTQLRIVEFAQDRSGEVYLVDFAGGGFHKIVNAPPESKTAKPFPRKLSETGLFASTKDHTPAPGVIPYSVNAPLWSDGAEKDRFIALPNNSKIEFDDVIYPHGPDYPDRGWRFPDGTVLVKTFSIAMDASQPAKRHRLETRLLHYRQMPGNDDEYGAQFWNGYTYVWNEDQTDADLLESSGLDRPLTIKDPTAPGGVRTHVWRFPSRAECALCHTMASKYVLGVTTLQMNKVHDYGGHKENQLTVLERLGVFTEKLPAPPDQLPSLANYHDTNQSLQLRARAYLHANCAHCHRKWGGGNADFELHASIPLTETLAVNTHAGQGSFGVSEPRILVPGQPDRSLLLTRIQLDGLGRMPHIASKVVDRNAVSLLRSWIASLDQPSALDTPGAIRPRLVDKK